MNNFIIFVNNHDYFLRKCVFLLEHCLLNFLPHMDFHSLLAFLVSDAFKLDFCLSPPPKITYERAGFSPI